MVQAVPLKLAMKIQTSNANAIHNITKKIIKVPLHYANSSLVHLQVARLFYVIVILLLCTNALLPMIHLCLLKSKHK